MQNISFTIACIYNINPCRHTLLKGRKVESIKDKEPGHYDRALCKRIFEVSVDAIVTADEDGKIILWNAASERMFGYSAEEASGFPIQDLVPEKYLERHCKGISRFRKTEKPVLAGKTVEVEGKRKDGSVFPVEMSLFADKSSGKWEFTAILRDITGRKSAEEQVLGQNLQLKRINAELSALFEVSSAVTHTIDLDALLLNILKAVTGLGISKIEKRGGIFLIDNEKLRLASHLGHTDDFINMHKDVKVGDCLCGTAAKTGEIIISKNSSTDARHTIRYRDIGTHGHIIVPLKANDVTLGVLYLYLPPDEEVDALELKTLESIGNLVGMAINNSKLYEKTKSLSMQDPLTGLANRRLMYLELDRNIAKAKRYKGPFSIIMIDIDHFKEYNDRHGHLAGDRLIEEFARLSLKAVRGADLVVRYGGEEFLILLPETDLKRAADVAERLRRAVEARKGVTISLGVASYNEEMKGADELIDAADETLYRAKTGGRNRVEVGG